MPTKTNNLTKLEYYKKKLRQSGFKNTVAKTALLSILLDSDQKHLTAEDIYKIVLQQDTDKAGTSKQFSLPTIYRILADFEDIGIVSKLRFEQSSYAYELSDETGHDHIICTQCDEIMEFYDKDVETALTKFSKQHDIVIKDRSLMLYSECIGRCDKKAESKT